MKKKMHAKKGLVFVYALCRLHSFHPRRMNILVGVGRPPIHNEGVRREKFIHVRKFKRVHSGAFWHARSLRWRVICTEGIAYFLKDNG